MKITTLKVVDVETGQVLKHSWYELSDDAPVDLACGASKEQKQAFQNEKKVSDLLTENFKEFAGENQAILGNLTNTLTPIETAGPSQFGMSAGQEAAERTMAAETISSAGAQASNAVRGALASRGGGTTYLPSGSEAAILGTLATETAQKEAEAQSFITERGYDIGRKNFEFATEGLMRAPGELEAPVTAAGAGAMGGAGQEMKGASDITAANNAWMAPVAGIVGSVASGLTGGLTSATPKPKPVGTSPGDPSWGGGGS
jgi:hypothetical protein